MSEYDQKIKMNQNISSLQTKHIYRLGAISSIIVAGSILLSIIAFFIWPYKAGMVSTESIFNLLQKDRLGGLISLDLPMLLIIPVNILPMLVLYYSLKRVNEFYALLALVIGLVGVVLLIPTRPLVELVNLSDQYTAAANEAIRNRYLASGDLLLGQFSGTAWVFQTVLFLISGIINAILMLHCPIFRRITALTELVVSIIGLGFFLPLIGVGLLFLNTIGAIFFYFLVAVDFFKAQKSTEMRRNGLILNKPDQKITRRRFLKVAGSALGAVIIASSGVSCAGQPLSDSKATALDTPEFIFEKENDMQPRLLVAYATAAGSTIGVAEAVGKTLATSGLSVDVKPIKNNPNLEGYQAVILGSAVHGGRWLPEAIKFIQDHQAELKRVPAAVFCVHILNLGSDEKSRQNRQAYLDPIRSLLPIVDEAYFAGKGIDPDSASPFEQLMAWLMQIPPGDKRDWDKIGTWADNIKGFDLIKNNKS